MSFYLMLSSDGSRDTYPNNHGGDFKVQLDHVLDMRSEPWEAALVEMTYTGQHFPNLSVQDEMITVHASGKPEFENDYIITFDQAKDLKAWFYVFERIGELDQKRGVKGAVFSLPCQHYSWRTFVDTFTALYREKFLSSNFTIEKDEFKFWEPSHSLLRTFQIMLSESFKNLFDISDSNLTPIHDHDGRRIHFKIPIVKPPVEVDDSQLIYTPNCIHKDVKFEVATLKIFEFTEQYCTVNMFTRAIRSLSADLPNDGFLWRMRVEDGKLWLQGNSKDNVRHRSETYGDGPIPVMLSLGFKALFQTSEYVYDLPFDKWLEIPLKFSEPVYL